MGRLVVTARAGILSYSSATGRELVVPLCMSIKDKIEVTFLSMTDFSHRVHSLFALCMLHV